ncbi:MAG: hypothetical protein LUE17_03325 [Planctomycetaceae bacterium]|nr:hypothetical protein [Planctomycetaceae bacterium]
MAVTVAPYAFGNVGRMYARQNVPALYGRQKAVAGVNGDDAPQSVDKVTLSANAPRPLTADYLEQALSAGQTLAAGGNTPDDTTERLREDRIFAAVSALAMMGHSGEKGEPVSWPGGLPSPSAEELEIARRRLAQRPQRLEDAADPQAVQTDRLTLLERLGRTDSAALAGALQPVAAG